MIDLDAVTIRPMRHQDVAAVRVIDTAVYSRPWSAALWRQELTDPQRHHLVATQEHDVIGHAGVLFMIDEAHVTTVAVDPASQGRGVATLLVLDLLDEARSRRLDAATLEVRSTDRRAQGIYTRLGFAPAGVRRSYYSDPVDDAVVMWLADLASDRVAHRLEPIRATLRERHRCQLMRI